LWQLAPTEERQKELMLAYLLGAAIAASGTILNYVRGATSFVYETRYAASGYDPNDLGVTLAIGIPLARLLQVHGNRFVRILTWAYLPLSLVAIALTSSRGAVITSIVALSVYAFTLRYAARRTLIVGSAVASLVGYAFLRFVPEGSWERLATIRDQISGGTLGERTPVWNAAIDIFSDHWLFGVGAGGFGDAIAHVLGIPTAPHNTLVSIGVELGVIGLILFVSAILATLRACRRLEGLERWVATILVATWAVGASSLGWDYRKTTWLVLGLAAAMAYRPVTTLHRLQPARSITGPGPGRPPAPIASGM
jgi:O-antigen ligase